MRCSFRPSAFLVAVALGMFTSPSASRLAFAQATPPDASAKSSAPVRVLSADGGLVLNFIKPDKTADFEAVVAKLKEALQKSPKPERRQQAAAWKIFKSVEPAAGGNVLYVFVMDPAVKGANYSVETILAEGFPSEVLTLYKQYSESFAAGYNFINLALVSDLGK